MSMIVDLKEILKLMSNSKKSETKIKKNKDKKLRNLLVYAYDNSKFYREYYSAYGFVRNDLLTCDISELPPIDKKIFVENFDNIVTVDDLSFETIMNFEKTEEDKTTLLNGKYHVVHTSGTTGKPTYFVYDEKAWKILSHSVIRGAFWNMSKKKFINIAKRKPRVLYLAMTNERFGGMLVVNSGVSAINTVQLQLDIQTPIEQWKKIVENFQPDMVVGYPSAIKILAGINEREGLDINVTRVCSSGEPLRKEVREYIAKYLCDDIINYYAASESLSIGVEGNDEEGIYLFEDLNYIEIINGEMYLTNLYNYSQPIIRYKLSDKLIKKGRGKGKYHFHRVEIKGCREEEILWFKNEEGSSDFVHPLVVDEWKMEEIIDYQCVQISDKEFTINIQIKKEEDINSVCEKISQQCRQLLFEKHMGNVKFDVKFVNEIYPDKNTGKKQLTIKNI